MTLLIRQMVQFLDHQWVSRFARAPLLDLVLFRIHGLEVEEHVILGGAFFVQSLAGVIALASP